MERATGGELFDRILDLGKYSEDEARRLVEKLLDVVAYMHSKNVIALVVQAGFHVRGVLGGVLHVLEFVEGNVRRIIIKTFEQNLNSAHKAGLLSATPLLTKKIFFIDGVFSKYFDKTSQFLYLF